MTPRSLVALLRRARRHGVLVGAQVAALAATRRLAEVARIQLLRLPAPPPSGRREAEDVVTRLATMDDLRPLARDSTWGFEDPEARDLELLLAAGHRCAVNLIEGEVVGYAWMNPHRICVPALEAAIALEPGEVHIYKGFTHPAARGRRLGRERFAFWFEVLGPGASLITDFAFDNHATMARIRPLGLEPIGFGTLLRVGRHRYRHLSPALKARVIRDLPRDLRHRDH